MTWLSWATSFSELINKISQNSTHQGLKKDSSIFHSQESSSSGQNRFSFHSYSVFQSQTIYHSETHCSEDWLTLPFARLLPFSTWTQSYVMLSPFLGAEYSHVTVFDQCRVGKSAGSRSAITFWTLPLSPSLPWHLPARCKALWGPPRP